MFSLSGKIVAVVGAGSGIGEAIAVGAADQGASYVACLDVNEAGAAATAARIRAPGQSVYSMTKAGILQLSKTAATEWATADVRVNAVGPGVVETPLTAPIKNNKDWYDAYARKSPMQRWAQPIEMVGPTLFLLSDAASYVTGPSIYG